jgi:hypothetical protein
MTHPVQGLDNYRQLIETLTFGKGVIKAFCEIAPLDAPNGGGGPGQRSRPHWLRPRLQVRPCRRRGALVALPPCRLRRQWRPGLGLSITSEFVRLIRGELRIDSPPGRGAHCDRPAPPREHSTELPGDTSRLLDWVWRTFAW